MVYIPPDRCSGKMSIFLNKRSIDEERCEVYFQPTEEEVQHTSHPDRSYSQHTLNLIMRACIILHNMIIDDERNDGYNGNYHTVTSVVAPPVTYELSASLTTIIRRETHLTSELMFLNLQSDLIEDV
jgi:hypothetical protein